MMVRSKKTGKSAYCKECRSLDVRPFSKLEIDWDKDLSGNTKMVQQWIKCNICGETSKVDH